MESTGTKFFIIFSLLIFFALVYLLAPVLTPFLSGALLAYLGDPLVNRLMKLHLPRIASVAIVFLFIFILIGLLILLLIPLIQKQVALLIDFIPSIVSVFQTYIEPWLQNYFGLESGFDVNTLKQTLSTHWAKAGGIAAWILHTTVTSGFALIAWFTNFLITLVVTFYLLRDWNAVVHGVRNLLPRRIEPTVVSLAQESDIVLSAFLRGQLLVMLSLSVFYAIGLSLTGLKVGIILGCIIGLLSIVPYLGVIVGVLSASIAAFVQFGTWSSVSLVLLVFILGQLFESLFLTPKLVGDRIGLHPVAVIFAVLAGGYLFGFFGVLLALPVAAVLMVMIRFLNDHYRTSKLYRA